MYLHYRKLLRLNPRVVTQKTVQSSYCVDAMKKMEHRKKQSKDRILATSPRIEGKEGGETMTAYARRIKKKTML